MSEASRTIEAGARGGGEPPRADYTLKWLRLNAKAALFAKAWR